MPIDLFEENRVNASALCFHIFDFLTAVQRYYSLFSFDGIVDINFQLEGIHDREFAYINQGDRRLLHTSYTYDEEIDPQTETLEISDIENQKQEICEQFLLPFYYDRNLEVLIGLFNDDGTPMYRP